MGAEQSSNRDRLERDRLERDNVEYILEQQRKIYEQRCRDLLRNQNNAQQGATATRSTSQLNQPRPATAAPLRPQPPPTRANNTVHQPNAPLFDNQNRSPSQLNQPRPATATAPLRPQPPPARANNTVQQLLNLTLDNQNGSASQLNQPRPATAAAPLQAQPPARANNTVQQPNILTLDNQNRSAPLLNQPGPTTATAPLRPTQPPPPRANNTVQENNNPSSNNQTRLASLLNQPGTTTATAPLLPTQPPPPRANNTVHQSNNPSSNNQIRIERSPAPYSYRQEDLQNATEAHSGNNLYPNLNNNAPTASTGGPSTSSFRFSNHSANYVQPAASDFVFVNKNGTERVPPTAPRERSVSRSRNTNSENEDLKCPTCKKIFTMYIFNCGSGHSSCKSCKERGAPCKVCGQRITDIRNHALEAYVAERKVPCFNKEDGCTLVFKLADMESHVKECPFKEMPCPMTALFEHCPWRGKLNHLAVHFDNMHSAQRQAEEGQEMFLPNICTDNKFVHLIVKGAYNFLFHVSVSQKDRMIYMTTQLIGTKFSAQKWTYEIQLYNKREPRRKYRYVDVCSSTVEPAGDIYREAKCAALPLSYAMNFVNEGAICYKFSLDKEFKGRSNFNNKNKRGRGRGGRHYS